MMVRNNFFSLIDYALIVCVCVCYRKNLIFFFINLKHFKFLKQGENFKVNKSGNKSISGAFVEKINYIFFFIVIKRRLFI